MVAESAVNLAVQLVENSVDRLVELKVVETAAL